MFTVVALGPVACYTNGTGSQLTTVNIEGIIDLGLFLVSIIELFGNCKGGTSWMRN